MTAPRTRRWITSAGQDVGGTVQFNHAIATGPVTVQRVFANVNGAVDGGATLRWPYWQWGLSVGVAAPSLALPLADESQWLVWRRAVMWNPATRPINTPSPPQDVDTEGQRVLEAGESLWLSFVTKDVSQVTDFIWYARVLVLDPV